MRASQRERPAAAAQCLWHRLSIILGCALLVAALFLGTQRARAQSRFQEECAKAQTLIERTNCGDLTLLQMKKQIALLYQKLLSKLNGRARAHVVKDQERWVAWRDREHLNPDNAYNSYAARLIRLKRLLDGLAVGPYPYVGDYVIVKNEKFRYGGFHVDAHYPQLDGDQHSAATTNREFLNLTQSGINQIEGIAEDVFKDPAPSSAVAEYEYAQGFTLHRPGPILISIDLWTSNYTGGAHANATDAAYLVNLRTGGFESLDRIFASGVDWRKQLAKIATEDYDRKYGSSGDQYYGAADILAVLEDPANYVFEEARLTILLNYNLPDISFSVQIPYTQIRHLLRSGGPIAPSASAQSN